MSDLVEYQPNCFQDIHQHYLLSITVHKARHLAVLNADTFVTVTFNGSRKRTGTARRTDCPFYNQYLSYKAFTSERILLAKTIRFCLRQLSCCGKIDSSVGSFTVDLRTVWTREHHAVVRQWAILEPTENFRYGHEHGVGFLQVDISVVASSRVPSVVAAYSVDWESIESNLLQHALFGEGRLQRVRYSVSIFRGKFKARGRYAVQVSFADMKGKTAYSDHAREFQWNEKVTFIGTLPSFSSYFILQLQQTDCCIASSRAELCLPLSSMSYKVEGLLSLPTFGPSYLHFYTGRQRSTFMGTALVSIIAEVVPESSVDLKKIQKIPTHNIADTSSWWQEESFTINLIVLNVQLLQSVRSGHVHLYLSCAHTRSNAAKLSLANYPTTGFQYVPFQGNERDCLSLTVQLPDYRNRNCYFVALRALRHKWQSAMDDYELFKVDGRNDESVMAEALRVLISELQQLSQDTSNFLKSKQFSKHTARDQVQRSHGVEQLSNFERTALSLKELLASSQPKVIAEIEEKIHTMLEHLSSLAKDVPNPYPDVLLHISRPNQTLDDAIYRFDLVEYFLATSAGDLAGLLAGKRSTIMPRSIHCSHSCAAWCGCLYGRLDIIMAIGTATEVDEWRAADWIELRPEILQARTESLVRCKLHLYQASIYTGFSQLGLCSGKIALLLENNEACSATIPATLAPRWMETIEFQNVKLIGAGDDPSLTMVLCFMDESSKVAQTIGIGWLKAAVGQHPSLVPKARQSRLSMLLQQYQLWPQFLLRKNAILRSVGLYKQGYKVCEILASAEIVLLPENTPKESHVSWAIQDLPTEIKPKMARYKVEVLFAGLRQLQKRSIRTTDKFRIHMDFGELSLSSGLSVQPAGQSVNLLGETIIGYVILPLQLSYWPPIVFQHVKYVRHNRVKLFGVGIAKCASQFYYQSPAIPKYRAPSRLVETVLEMPEDETKPLLPKSVAEQLQDNVLSRWNELQQMLKLTTEETSTILPSKRKVSDPVVGYTWWTKFYNSLGHEDGGEHKHTLKIYETELENVTEFEGFHDWSASFPLYKKIKRSKQGQMRCYGTLKCKVLITVDETSAQHGMLSIAPPLQDTIQLKVVIYVVQGLNLVSRDAFSDSDPYIVVTYGSETVRDRTNYVPNQSSPIFGRRFEVAGCLPRDQLLHLSLYDHDYASKDDLIGSTTIDIEDRFQSRHRPGFGIPMAYSSGGYNHWRYPQKPSVLLKQLCDLYEIDPPKFRRQGLEVGGMLFTPDAAILETVEDPRECISLMALNNLSRIPSFGFSLTPEHVETRSLYHPARPGIEQGKVQLWIEIYQSEELQAIPLDLTPRPPQSYELRVIVWNTSDVVLSERNVFGTAMSDIYVKCWLQDFSEAQCTDVHYRSLTGEGNFNWRMIFPFKYTPATGMMVLKDRNGDRKVPPVLTVQVWDNDSLSADDFLGTSNLQLSHLPVASGTAAKCTLDAIGPGNASHQNLFYRRRVRGWYPIYGRETGLPRQSIALTGKVELELELVSGEDATLAPVGMGRAPPQHLPDPLRPETSFHWLRQPTRTFRTILWPRIRRGALYTALMAFTCSVVYGIAVNVPRIFLTEPLERRPSSEP